MGVCVCGAKRIDHTDAALAKHEGSKKTKMQMVEEKVYAPCVRFELNMDPTVPFGTCMCGRPRVEHTPKALATDDARRGSTNKVRAEQLLRLLTMSTRVVHQWLFYTIIHSPSTA